MDRNTTLTLTAYLLFFIAAIHIARVVLGGEIILLGINLPYALSIFIAVGVSYLGWLLFKHRN
ncbi:hypothetical protein OAK06_06475 [Gammaproteobacteria bacterium]|nr:hypothetical protein [Gammaproteobacteria bacterium]